jgi:hypothetical protein
MFTDLIKGLELTEEQKATLKANFETVHETIKEVVSNDPNVVSKLKNGAFEEAKRKLISALGIDKEEAKELDYTGLVKLAKEKVSEVVKTTENEKDAEIIKLKQTIQQIETETIPSLKNQSIEEIKKFKIKNKVIEALSGIELIAGISRESAQILFEAKLAKFDTKIDENDNVEVLTKDGLKPTFENKIVSDLPTIARTMLTADGLVKQNNNGTPPPTPNGVNGVTADKMPKDVAEKIAQMKAEMSAK